MNDKSEMEKARDMHISENYSNRVLIFTESNPCIHMFGGDATSEILEGKKAVRVPTMEIPGEAARFIASKAFEAAWRAGRKALLEEAREINLKELKHSGNNEFTTSTSIDLQNLQKLAEEK